MATHSAKGQAAREFLASLPEFRDGDKPVGELSDAYANRIARRAQGDLAAGRTPSRQAGRGHILTPEHGPSGARPKLPEPADVYKSPLAPEAPERPLVHTRPLFHEHIQFPSGQELFTRTNQREALEVLRYAAKDTAQSEWGAPVTLQVYDCSQARFFRIDFHHGHGSGHGINARALLEDIRESGLSLEQYLINVISARKSDVTALVQHICLYEIVILPPAPAGGAAVAPGPMTSAVERIRRFQRR